MKRWIPDFSGMTYRGDGNDRKSNEIMRLQHRFDPRNDRGVRWKANSFNNSPPPPLKPLSDKGFMKV
jgi:hypothetical protein